MVVNDVGLSGGAFDELDNNLTKDEKRIEFEIRKEKILLF